MNRRTAVLLFALLLMAGCRGTGDRQAPERYRVRLDTSKGNVVIEVVRAWAPVGADRFYTLVQNGYYDGARFFRVLPGFVVQFGLAADPKLTAEWYERKMPDDPAVGQSNQRGLVSYATSGPNSRTTQVFINLADNRRLDPRGFVPFGTVVEGMEVVDRFNAEYGEGAPRGEGPSQDRIRAEGNTYLERDFPRLDYIKRASIL